jgi:hypothetical protein
MRIRGAASPPQSRGCLLEETPSCGGTGISTPSAASPLRAGQEGQPIATRIRLLCEHRR